MELASMLAGEQFSDHPQSVCPVIGSFLRAYNDSVDDQRRQDLYAVAAAVVGTRGSREVEEARAARLAEWTEQRRTHRRVRSLLPRPLSKIGLGGIPPLESTAMLAVRSITRHNDEEHREVLALIDELIAIREPAARAASTPADLGPAVAVPVDEEARPGVAS
jgi:hypothetical protein